MTRAIFDRLVFSGQRCACGAGLACDPANDKPPAAGRTRYECSDILCYAELEPERQAEVRSKQHPPHMMPPRRDPAELPWTGEQR